MSPENSEGTLTLRYGSQDLHCPAGSPGLLRSPAPAFRVGSGKELALSLSLEIRATEAWRRLGEGCPAAPQRSATLPPGRKFSECLPQLSCLGTCYCGAGSMLHPLLFSGSSWKSLLLPSSLNPPEMPLQPGPLSAGSTWDLSQADRYRTCVYKFSPKPPLVPAPVPCHSLLSAWIFPAQKQCLRPCLSPQETPGATIQVEVRELQK